MSTNEILNHEECLNKKKIKTIDLISFMFGFGQALLIYILSSYLQKFFGTDNVGLFYGLAYILILIALLNLHKIVKIIGEANTFFLSLFSQIFSLLILYFFSGSAYGAVFLVTFVIASNLSVVGLDFILESFSTDRVSGRIRGLYLSLSNAGFIFGPLLSTNLLEKYGFGGAFLLALVIYVFIFTFSFYGLKGANYKFTGRTAIKELLGRVWQRKNVLRIYYINFILEVFYAIMIIYSPIYLRDLGFSWPQIGLVFTIMLIPFVVLPYPLGWLADTKWGEKEILFAAIIILSLSIFSFYFINTASIIIWALVMFISRLGASAIQTMRDSYFYKRIDRADIDLIDFFRTAVPVAYILAIIFSFISLQFFPLKYIFIFLAILIISGLYPVARMVDSR